MSPEQLGYIPPEADFKAPKAPDFAGAINTQDALSNSIRTTLNPETAETSETTSPIDSPESLVDSPDTVDFVPSPSLETLEKTKEKAPVEAPEENQQPPFETPETDQLDPSPETNQFAESVQTPEEAPEEPPETPQSEFDQKLALRHASLKTIQLVGKLKPMNKEIRLILQRQKKSKVALEIN